MKPWISLAAIKKRMKQIGYEFIRHGERENQTDGEAHLVFVKNGTEFQLRGNYYDGSTFDFPKKE